MVELVVHGSDATIYSGGKDGEEIIETDKCIYLDGSGDTSDAEPCVCSNRYVSKFKCLWRCTYRAVRGRNAVRAISPLQRQGFSG